MERLDALTASNDSLMSKDEKRNRLADNVSRNVINTERRSQDPPGEKATCDISGIFTGNIEQAELQSTALEGTFIPQSESKASSEHEKLHSGVKSSSHSGLGYKDQVTNRTSSQSTPRQVSGRVQKERENGGSVTVQQQDRQNSNLIVVSAVHVTDSDIITGNESPLQDRSGIQNDSGGTTGPPLSEDWQRIKFAFVMKVVMLALFLNTILVAGLFAGAFCLTGACGTWRAVSQGSPPIVIWPSVGPTTESSTLAPTGGTSGVPTSLAPTVAPTTESSTSSAPTVVALAIFGPVIGFIPTPTTSVPPPTTLTPSPTTSLPSPPTFIPPPADILSPPTTFVPDTIAPTEAPTDDFLVPTAARDRSPLATLIPIAVVAELIIVGGLFMWYKRWRAKYIL